MIWLLLKFRYRLEDIPFQWTIAYALQPGMIARTPDDGEIGPAVPPEAHDFLQTLRATLPDANSQMDHFNEYVMSSSDDENPHGTVDAQINRLIAPVIERMRDIARRSLDRAQDLVALVDDACSQVEESHQIRHGDAEKIDHRPSLKRFGAIPGDGKRPSKRRLQQSLHGRVLDEPWADHGWSDDEDGL